MTDKIDSQLDKAKRDLETAQKRLKRLKTDKVIRDLKRENEALRQAKSDSKNEEYNRLLNGIKTLENLASMWKPFNVKIIGNEDVSHEVQAVKFADVKANLEKLLDGEQLQ